MFYTRVGQLDMSALIVMRIIMVIFVQITLAKVRLMDFQHIDLKMLNLILFMLGSKVV